LIWSERLIKRGDCLFSAKFFLEKRLKIKFIR
jgi:hypothetical protein